MSNIQTYLDYKMAAKLKRFIKSILCLPLFVLLLFELNKKLRKIKGVERVNLVIKGRCRVAATHLKTVSKGDDT